MRDPIALREEIGDTKWDGVRYRAWIMLGGKPRYILSPSRLDALELVRDEHVLRYLIDMGL